MTEHGQRITIHEGTKEANTTAEKQDNVLLGETTRHCAKCLNLNGCYFPLDNMPEQPLHPYCHCYKTIIDRPIAGVSAKSDLPIEKITQYAFVDEGKKGFFESNGYRVKDAEQMQAAIEKQAVEKYCAGEFQLGGLTEHGQRITILVELRSETGEVLTFLTGWMVFPDGTIVNTTPMASADRKKIEKFKERVK